MKLRDRLFGGKAPGREAGSPPRGVDSSRAAGSSDAEFLVQRALMAAAMHNSEGDHARALACIDTLLASWPDNVELLIARGTTLYEWGRAREALAELRRSVTLGAGDRTLAYKLGWTCLLANESREALRWMQSAVELDDAANARFGLAIALEANGQDERAIDNFRLALDGNDTNFAYLIQYGLCLMERRRLDEAESLFRRAIELQPESPVGWTNLGVALSRQRRRTEALAALKHADRLETTTGETANNFINLAVELSDDSRLDEALAVYERHLPGAPSLVAHFAYAGVLLRAGRMEEGWIQYEYRLVQDLPRVLQDCHPRPTRSGQALVGRTILVETEQGYGDTIQFARYLLLIKLRGATVILRVPPALARFALGFRGVDRVVTSDDTLPEHDFRIPLLSLPLLLGADADTISGETPYLRADERRKDAWRERLGPWSGTTVGLAWAGNPNHTRDEYRSIELMAFAPLAAKAIRFVSLQKDNTGIWGSNPPPGLDLVHVAAELHDFEDTAALIDTLDLVISVDTSVLHLAGALGKPTWALLTAPPDFRWLDSGETTAWYPTMRLFRQRHRDDWSEVVDRVASALEEACQSRRFGPDEVSETTPASTSRGATDRGRRGARGQVEGRRLFIVGDTRYGMMQYRIDDRPVGVCLDRYGEYLQPALDALEHFLRPGMVVFESAAGIGAHSVPLARLLGPSGHLMLHEEEHVFRCVLEQNLRIAGAANVTTLRVTNRPTSLDDLGLRNLDLYKANRWHDRDSLEGALRTLRTLRPAVFVEGAEPADLTAIASQLESLDYNARCRAIPYFDPNNFRGSHVDVFESRKTFALLAIPRERDTTTQAA